MGIQINGNTDNISATDGGLTVSDLEINQSGISTFNAGVGIGDSIFHLGDDNTQIRFPAADTITAETGGTERLRISSGGGVYIGNTGNSFNSVLGVHKAASNAQSFIVITNNSTGTTTNDGFVVGLNGSQEALLFNKESTPMRFATAGSERLRITSGGDIQVDNGNLHIDDNGEFAIFEQDTSLAMTNSSKISMDFASNVARIRSSHNGSGGNAVSRPLAFFIASSEKVRIASDGDMGVGTNSPSARLHVSGGDGLFVERSAGTSIAGFKHSGASAMNIYFQNTGSTNHPYIGSSNQDLTLGTNNLERLRITSGGDTTINGDLTVSSGTSGDAKLIIEADTDNNDEGDNPTLVFKQDGGLEVSSIGHGLLSGDQNGLVIANSCSNGYIKFATGLTNGHTNATERLTIDGNGKFCLGTYNSNFASNDGIVSIVNAAGAGTENTLLTLWNPTTVADARAGIDFLTNAQYGTGRDGAFIRGSNDGVTAKAHLQFGTIKDETYTENFRISADGNVIKPNSCCFQAVVNGSHVSAGSYVVFGSVDVNRGNDYNSSNGIFTAPVAGVYLFHISSIAFNNASTVFRFYLRINNGNTGSGGDAHLRIDRTNHSAGGKYGTNASYTYYKYLNQNDTARVYFIPDDNSANAYGGADYFKFAGHLVG